MNKITKHFHTIGQAILRGGTWASEASKVGVKYLHSEAPAPDWQDIPTERDAFTQYEPPTRTLTAKLGDLALYRHLSARNSQDDVLAVMTA